MGSGMEHHGRLRQVPPPPHDDGPENFENPDLVLDAVRDVLNEQRGEAERLRSSARQTFVFVTVLFTIAQTAVFAEFGGKGALTPGEKTWLLSLGLASVVGVGVTGFLALYADVLQSAPAV